MGYQQDREAFINQFARVFPKAPFSVALTFLREASGSQRYNEIASSIDVGEKELNRLELADERRDLRVTMLAASIGATIETGGDPRGCDRPRWPGRRGATSRGRPRRGAAPHPTQAAPARR